MRLLIVFKTPLLRLEGSGWPVPGWRLVSTGVIFPLEVVTDADMDRTLALEPPTRLVFEDDVVVLQWERLEKTIGISVPTSVIADLVLQWY